MKKSSKRVFIEFPKIISSGGLVTLLLGLMLSTGAQAQDLKQAKALCSDLTPANRAMAERAGYNVDEVCSEIKSTPAAQKALPQTKKVPRPSVSAPAKPNGKPKTVSTIVAPVQVSGVKSATNPSRLKPFGYDLFANAPTTFAPAESLPVAGDYLLGPGDTLDILFYGKINSTFSLEINREGFVDFPELGPVGLAGLSYSEAKEMLQTRIAAQIVGTKVSITMGSLRTMQIFVLGEAHKPGAYTVSSLSTIMHALVSSGGVSSIGSLRNIQLKRQGKVVATLDLYDLLLKGDTSNDLRIQAKDVVYIPTVGDVVSIDGQILRPAIYELKGGETIKDLVLLSGGMGPKAFPSSAEIRRINNDGFMTVVDVDLSRSIESDLPLKKGDHLTINAIINENKGVVTLTGHVYHPGQFALKNRMRVSDLLSEIGEYKEGLDFDYAILTRTDPVTGYKSALSIKPSALLDKISENKANVNLQDKDILRLFSIDGDRAAALSDIVEALRRQNRAGELPAVATVSGARLSGTFPITKGMRISDLVAAAGGLTPNYADFNYSLLVREELSALGDIEVLSVNLRKALNDSEGPDDLLIQPKDRLFVFSVNEARPKTLTSVVSELRAQAELDQSPKVVTLGGTVRFPGAFPLTKGMTVKDAIVAAGGFVESAYRRSAEIARLDLSDPDEAVTTILIADLEGSYDAELFPQDSVRFRVIPNFKEIQTISLEGEFVFPGTYAFEKGETLTSVIQRAGGFTDEAFIDGSVFLRKELQKREEAELARLSELLKEQVSFERLQDVNSDSDISSGDFAAQQSAVESLSRARAIGRLVIPLRDVLASNANDILLKENDRLLIPKFSQEVSVIGEVQRPTSFLFGQELSRSDYLELAGGLKDSADKRSIYVVKAGGEVVFSDGWLFKFLPNSSGIEAGDTIVVPVDTDSSRIRGIPLLAEVSTIVYQLALGAAAINSFNTK